MKMDPRAFKGLSRFLAPSAGGPLADRALAEKLITPEQLQACIEEQDRSGRPLDEILVERGFLRSEDTVRLRAPAVPAEALAAAADPTRVVAHYILVERSGAGGMAEVWKGWDRSLGRWVALKFLKDEIGHPSQRIEREGRMAGGLSHPGVISIYERGVHQGRPYLVMPFVDGAAPKVPLPAAEAVRLALEVARALMHAHAAGVIHRDVKPGNILMDAAGRVLLADFGLAIASNSATSRWALSGTPEYASPEQVRGDVLDPRTDIYSLGATLYHYVTGRPPFAGESVAEIGRQVLAGKPAPPREAPSRLRGILAKSMAADRGLRYADMGSFARDLAELLDALRRPRAARWRLAAGLLLAGLLPSLVTFIVLRAQARSELRREADRYISEGRGRLLAGERLLADASTPATACAAELARASAALRLAYSLGEPVRHEAGLELGRAFELLGYTQRAEEIYRALLPDPAAGEALVRVLLRRLVEARHPRDWPAGEVQRHLDLAAPLRRDRYRAFVERRWTDVLASIGAPDPQDDLTLLLAAWAGLQAGKAVEALPWARAAVRFRRLDANALYVLARVELAAGERDAARKTYQEAQRQGPPGWVLAEDVERALKALK